MIYGLPYRGSKNKIAEALIWALPDGKRFVDLFGGGALCAIAPSFLGNIKIYYITMLHRSRPIISDAPLDVQKICFLLLFRGMIFFLCGKNPDISVLCGLSNQMVKIISQATKKRNSARLCIIQNAENLFLWGICAVITLSRVSIAI